MALSRGIFDSLGAESMWRGDGLPSLLVVQYYGSRSLRSSFQVKKSKNALLHELPGALRDRKVSVSESEAVLWKYMLMVQAVLTGHLTG